MNTVKESLVHRQVILKLEQASGSPGGLNETDCWALSTEFLIQQGSGEPENLHF